MWRLFCWKQESKVKSFTCQLCDYPFPTRQEESKLPVPMMEESYARYFCLEKDVFQRTSCCKNIFHIIFQNWYLCEKARIRIQIRANLLDPDPIVSTTLLVVFLKDHTYPFFHLTSNLGLVFTTLFVHYSQSELSPLSPLCGGPPGRDLYGRI